MPFNEKTPEQQKNFVILRDGLVETYGDAENDPRFSMREFQKWKGAAVMVCDAIDSIDGIHECQTSACVLGHGPMFGITPNENNTSWFEYSSQKFGLSKDDKDWYFLFSGEWPDDIQQAIRRLTLYIDSGFSSREWVDSCPTYNARF